MNQINRTLIRGSLILTTTAILLITGATWVRAQRGLALNPPALLIKPASPVEVTNTPLPTINVNEPAFQPYQIELDGTISSDQLGFSGNVHIGFVPTGKRFVIEYVSLRGELPEDQAMTFAWIQVNDGFHHFIPWVPQGVMFGKNTFTGGGPVKLYADAGTPVDVAVQKSGFAKEGFYRVAVSGYLVDMAQIIPR